MSEETQETRPVNGKSMYSYIADAWNVPSKSYVKELNYEEAHPPRQGQGPRIQGETGLRRRQGQGQEGKLPEEGHRDR